MTDAALPAPTLRDRLFGPTERERYFESQIAAVEIVLNKMATAAENGEIGQYGSLAEGLGRVEMMIDAQGWTSVFDYGEDSGLTLRQIKDASMQLRELLVGNPFVKNGFRTRHANTWGGGIEFSCKNRTGKNPETKQLPVAIQNLMEDPRAMRYVFGNDAHEEMESAAFSDGNFFLLGQDSNKKMQRIQIHELTADYRNPNNTEEIWAYLREWTQDPTDTNRKPMKRWYYTDIYDGTRKKSISINGELIKVETGFTMLDKQVNRQVGWAYGVPDGLAIVAWAKLYKEFLVNGYIMSRALARLAFKVTANTAKGGDKAATEVAMPGQAGATIIEGAGNNLQSLVTAGRGYDFASGNPLAAAMAAGLGVSLLALTSNPAAATGSNAAAQTLDPIAKATAAVRRASWDDYWVRVFRWMGLGQRLVVTWHDLITDTIQRQLQAWTLFNNSGLFEGDVSQVGMAKAMQVAYPGSIPKGYLTPNNADSLARKDLDTDGSGDNGTAPKPTAGSGQGTDDGTGKSQPDHDDDAQ